MCALQNKLEHLRIRSHKHELMIAPGAKTQRKQSLGSVCTISTNQHK